MDSTVTCPAKEKLEDLLANRLLAEEAAQIRQHLRDCPACRNLLTCQPVEGERFPFLEPPRSAGELGWLATFRVLAVLGTGGMAIVFDAEDTLLHRRVALKVLRPEISDEALRERFLREARLLAGISNEHIVSIFQVGETNGIPFIAMERLEGMTLAERLRRDHWLPLVEALRLAGQVAQGLIVTHQFGLVHRDIKPANIWLESRNGRFRRVKLIDFGIARRMDAPSKLTVAGQVIGTPIFMAPEQAAGLPVDARTDLYSLGCVLYQMLTGQPPAGGEYPVSKLLQGIVDGTVTVVRNRAAQMPAPVARLLQQLLHHNPDQRPASAAIVAESLHRLEQEAQVEPVSDVPPHVPPMVRRQVRHANRFAIFLGAFAVAASVVVGVVAAWYRMQPQSPDLPRDRPVFSGPKLKIGILHSLDGITASQERPILHALQLAVQEINDAGGVLQRQLDPHEADGGSDEVTFAETARKLIDDDKVEVLFGCWTSSSRRQVAEVCQKGDRLLFYSAGTEGLETSSSVVCLGGTPNQTAVPLIDWFHHDKGKQRFYLIGAETVYCHSLHAILEHEITRVKASVVGQIFVAPTENDFAALVQKIKDAKPEVILNTIAGPKNGALLKQLRKAGIQPATLPTVWFAIAESELGQFPSAELAGDYSVACYFESLDRPENQDFLQRFRKNFGDRERVNDDMQTAYASVYLWKDAVEQAGRAETRFIRRTLRGLSVQAPCGPIRIDPTTQYAYRTMFIGEIVAGKPLAQFRIIWSSPEPLPPDPYPSWRTHDEWKDFLNGLYQKWGQRWEKRR